jgi:hypothetical protein
VNEAPAPGSPSTTNLPPCARATSETRARPTGLSGIESLAVVDHGDVHQLSRHCQLDPDVAIGRRVGDGVVDKCHQRAAEGRRRPAHDESVVGGGIGPNGQLDRVKLGHRVQAFGDVGRQLGQVHQVGAVRPMAAPTLTELG